MGWQTGARTVLSESTSVKTHLTMNSLFSANGVRISRALLWVVALTGASSVPAIDWPQYRGPNHDGISTETIRTNWSSDAPRQLW